MEDTREKLVEELHEKYIRIRKEEGYISPMIDNCPACGEFLFKNSISSYCINKECERNMKIYLHDELMVSFYTLPEHRKNMFFIMADIIAEMKKEQRL